MANGPMKLWEKDLTLYIGSSILTPVFENAVGPKHLMLTMWEGTAGRIQVKGHIVYLRQLLF